MSIPTRGGYPVLKDYVPLLYSKNLLEAEHDNLIFHNFVNRNYEGQLKEKGDKVIIRKEPDLKTFQYVKGTPVQYPEYETESEEFTVNRARIVPFTINKIDQMMSDIPSWTDRWAKLGGIALAEYKEKEFFQDVPFKCAVENQGNAAGLHSGLYNLGSATTPVKVVASGATGANERNAVDIISEAAACLAEQPGGMADYSYIVIPPIFAQRIQTSELKQASLSGDSVSTLRKGLKAIGNLCGFDIYQSNLLDMRVAAGGSTKYFTCLFGDKSAITYCDQISLTEVKPDPYVFAQHNHASVSIYDWKAIKPHHFGTLAVTF